MREPDLSSDGPAKLPDGGKLSERDRRLAHVVWGYDARDARPWRAWNEVDYAEPRAGSAHGKGGSHRVDRLRRMAANFNLHGSNAVHDRRADVDYRRFRSRPTPGEHLPAERRNGHHQRKRSNNRPIRCHDPPIVAASRAARWLSRSHRADPMSFACTPCPHRSDRVLRRSEGTRQKIDLRTGMMSSMERAFEEWRRRRGERQRGDVA